MTSHGNHGGRALTMTRGSELVQLPAYVRAVTSQSTGRDAFYFECPTWARRQGCPVGSCRLGEDLDVAVARGLTLGAELHAWMRGRHSLQVASGPLPGSLDALVAVYKNHRNYRSLAENSRRSYDKSLRTLTSHEMRSGAHQGIPLGRLPWQQIDAQFVDTLIDDLLVRIVEVDGELQVIRTPRRARSIISTAATMWAVARIAGGLPATENPFLGHRIRHAAQETTAASADQLCDVVGEADALGNAALGAILLAVWEFVWRPEHVVWRFMVEHYRPPGRSGEILITDAKNGVQRWRPLFDSAGEPQYPGLIARLDALKGRRSSGYMFARDGADGPPPSMVTVRTWLSEAAERTDHKGLTLATFRHGGLSECGEAGLNPLEIRRLSHHKTIAILGRYVHGTSMGQEISQGKRIEHRKGRRASTRGTRLLSGAPDGEDDPA